ncbi:MAG: hypothetical protein GX594_11915 [Pirellulaceae bacterium]|nr:hypothetical protein [Pirellulaceae bacterium]
MFIRMGTIALALAAWLASSAFAGDAYYEIPIRELTLTEGELPVRKDASQWRPYAQTERLRAMRPYAVLDEQGEVYVFGQGEQRDTWYSPYDPINSPIYSPATEAAATPVGPTTYAPPPASNTNVSRTGITIVYIKAPEGKAITGRLYVPNEALTEMSALKFTVPSSAAKADAKMPFLWAKRSHYESLHRRDLPGGAWFRHQANAALIELNPQASKTSDTRAPELRFNRNDEISRTYELFTGGRAMSENLQLDRALPELGPNQNPVKVATLAGITIAEIDWKPLIGDGQAELDPLAVKIPADQHVVFFPSFQAAAAVADEAGRHDTPVLRLAQPRSEDARVVDRYQRQLGLPMSEIARLLGPHVVKSMALTGSDPYYPLGTDVAVLFESSQPAVLEKLLLGRITLAAAEMEGVRPVKGEIDGLNYRGFIAADRSMSSYVARLDGAVVVTNSTHQLRRLAAVGRGEADSIASLPEFKFFRIRYPLGAADETALAFISDATIRRWCGPRWRIADSRRTRVRAMLAELQAAHLDKLVRQTARPGPIHSPFPGFGGELSLTSAGAASSIYGSLDFSTPIAEIPLEEVTRAEAEAYGRWRDGYQRNWSWAFDPIALKIGLAEDRLVADMTVMPLIISSEYNEFTSIALNGKFEPTDGDRHDALVQFMLAIDHKSRMFEQGNNFASMLGKSVSLGWIGRWVQLYADNDPFWLDLAQADPDKLGEFFEKNMGRLPVALRIDSNNPLKLAAFLAGARAFIQQTAPGLTVWEALEYREQPYVRITPKKDAGGYPRELENVNIFYTTIDGALTVTLSETVLKNSIDRSLARQKAAAEENARADDAQPWLGSNVALRVDNKILDIVNAANRKQYEEAMTLLCWKNLPILNEWRRLYPDRDPIEVHRQIWGVELVCPGGGKYIWNDKFQTMESTVYGHPGEQKQGPNAPPVLSDFSAGNFGLTLENNGLRARAVLERPRTEKSPGSRLAK